MDFKLDIVNILVLIVTVVNIIYGLIVYSRNRKDKTNLSFFILTLGVGFWGLSMFAYRWFRSEDLALIFSRILYLAAATIPISFLYFVFIFPNKDWKANIWQKIILPLPFILVATISLWPNILIRGVNLFSSTENFIIFDQRFHLLYGIYIVSYFGASYLWLAKKLLRSSGIFRQQIIYIIVGTSISTSIGVTTNLIMPYVGNFTLNWLGQVGVIVMIVAISYAILKHHLFNIRVITTEVFFFSIWTFILIRTLLTENESEKLTNFGLLALTVVIGLLLIRSVRKLDVANRQLVVANEKEIQHRKEVEKLNQELQITNEKIDKTNKELDKVNAELEVANKRQKSLLHEINHDVKEILTEATGGFSALKDGDLGELPSTAKTFIETAFAKVREGTRRVMDFLHATNLDKGTVSFAMKPFDLRQTIEKVIDNHKQTAEEEGLKLEINIKDADYMFTGDEGQLSLHVFDNLISNAISYNTPLGVITVLLSKPDDKILFTVKDTGIGITPEDMANLFTEGGHGKESTKINVHSTGNGLFIAKGTVLAHHGKIWAESEGAGKGSTFFVELPVM